MAAQAISEQRSYGAVARTLHWLVFALLVTQYGIAFTMPEIGPDTPQEGLVNWHLSIGSTILVIVVLRLIWRLLHPTPLSPTMPVWEQRLALGTHRLFYLLLILLPLLGWAGAGYFGYTVRLFGAIPLPALAAKGEGWAEVAAETHHLLTFVLLAVIALHVSGALYHYLLLRDRVLQRMLPGV